MDRLQPLEVDLDVAFDLSAAGASDVLTDTVDYGVICSVVEGVVTGAHVTLLEHLAERVATAVLETDPRIATTTVWLRKLRPPVPQDLRTSGVRITRHRG